MNDLRVCFVRGYGFVAALRLFKSIGLGSKFKRILSPALRSSVATLMSVSPKVALEFFRAVKEVSVHLESADLRAWAELGKRIALNSSEEASEFFRYSAETLGQSLPTNYFLRELPGILLVLLYVGALPVILGRKVFKPYYAKLGAPRYYVTVFLFLMMMALPIKMLLRWIFNLKYIVGIPEIFFNI